MIPITNFGNKLEINYNNISLKICNFLEGWLAVSTAHMRQLASISSIAVKVNICMCLTFIFIHALSFHKIRSLSAPIIENDNKSVRQTSSSKNKSLETHTYIPKRTNLLRATEYAQSIYFLYIILEN